MLAGGNRHGAAKKNQKEKWRRNAKQKSTYARVHPQTKQGTDERPVTHMDDYLRNIN